MARPTQLGPGGSGPKTMPLQLSRCCGPDRMPGTHARKESNLRPTVLETAAPPGLERKKITVGAQDVMHATLWSRGTFSNYEQRMTGPPVLTGSRIPSHCSWSSDWPIEHATAPALNEADPRSFLSAKTLRVMETIMKHRADAVNGFSDGWHPATEGLEAGCAAYTPSWS